MSMRICRTCNLPKEERDFSASIAKIKNTGLCKLCKNKQDREYRKRNPHISKNWWKKYKDEKGTTEIKKIQKRSQNRFRFGVSDKSEVVNENSRCENCGMTQTDHLEKWSLSLNIHHRDGKGRHNNNKGIKPNNSIENLQILCQSCHTRLHNLTRVNRDYKNNATGLKRSWAERKQTNGI